MEDENCMSERGGGEGMAEREMRLMMNCRYTVNANVAGWTLKSATRLYVFLSICESHTTPYLITIHMARAR